jgi:hypothetical protein
VGKVIAVVEWRVVVIVNVFGMNVLAFLAHDLEERLAVRQKLLRDLAAARRSSGSLTRSYASSASS